MYKTKQNYLKFQSHDIFGDKFQSYPKEMQATYWYQVWWIINHFETLMNGVDKDVLARVATEIMSAPTVEDQLKK